MKILITIMFCLTLVSGISSYFRSFYSSNESYGPRYNWTTFTSFWNKNAIPSIKIRQSQKTENGYVVDYGRSVILRAIMNDDVISSVCANYSGGNNNEGGVLFTRVKNRMIKVGTFRWPYENVAEVTKLFEYIGKNEKFYNYNTSSFSLYHSNAIGWTMCLKFSQG